MFSCLGNAFIIIIFIFLVTTTTTTTLATENNNILNSKQKKYQHWYTYSHSSGNRILPSTTTTTAHYGGGTFPDDVEQIDVKFSADIEWIIGTTTNKNTDARFVVTTADGKAYSIQGTTTTAADDYDRSGYNMVQLNYTANLRSDQPPLVRTIIEGDDGDDIIVDDSSLLPEIVQLPLTAKISPLSHPVPVVGRGKRRRYIYIDTNGKKFNSEKGTSGDIVLWDEEMGIELDRLSNIDALQDGRIVIANRRKEKDEDATTTTTLYALYGGSTIYSHCVLGDCIESSRLLIIRVDDDNNNKLIIEQDIQLSNKNDVFEGMSPMFLSDDGERIVTTVANVRNGAWLQIYNVDTGEIVSKGPSIGWGWRHMLCYHNFGDSSSSSSSSSNLPTDDNNDNNNEQFHDNNNNMLMVDILTPHVRKELEFFDVSKPNMDLRVETSKYTTHDIGSRILDTGLCADLNGDCINEVIVLDKSLKSIKGIQLITNNNNNNKGTNVKPTAVEVFTLPLPGKLSSNLAAVTLVKRGEEEDGRGGGIALAAASGTTMRMWLPPPRHTNNNNNNNEESDYDVGTNSNDTNASIMNNNNNNNKTFCRPGPTSSAYRNTDSGSRRGLSILMVLFKMLLFISFSMLIII